ncbi:glycosyltransferase family 9 protein [Mariniflexile ostreae]|uniref:Glycosyltransferase family 9 protein n=1 Tax=Mariniflexile ostreae TaxID=1520892 RepID=A0ABV5F7Z8_9FLAO
MAKLPKHILVIRLSAMGDVAMMVPVLQALTQQNPAPKITLLTRSFFKPFFRHLPNVTIYSIDTEGKHKGVLGLYKLSRALKKLDIDAIADLHNVIRSNILRMFLTGIPFVQLDKARAEKRDLISGKSFRQLKSTHQRYADVFKRLGFKINLEKPFFPEPRPLNDKIQNIVKNTNLKWVGIAPFAAHESKMYPLDLMDTVIESLSKKYQVILFGGGDEEVVILSEFEKKHHQVVNVAGKLSLDEELDLISNLDVMLAMDSGNAHIAAMMGVKVVTIWGVTHPYAGFAPIYQPEDYALLSDRDMYPKIPTSIYGNKYPEAYKDAMDSILPKTILEKIDSII